MCINGSITILGSIYFGCITENYVSIIFGAIIYLVALLDYYYLVVLLNTYTVM